MAIYHFDTLPCQAFDTCVFAAFAPWNCKFVSHERLFFGYPPIYQLLKSIFPNNNQRTSRRQNNFILQKILRRATDRCQISV